MYFDFIFIFVYNILVYLLYLRVKKIKIHFSNEQVMRHIFIVSIYKHIALPT